MVLVPVVGDEAAAVRIERHVAREPDGLGDGLLAGPRRPRHQRGDVAQAVVEGAHVGTQVVGEYRAPPVGAERPRRARRPDEVRREEMQGAPHLEAASEDVLRRRRAQERALEAEEPLVLGREVPVEGGASVAHVARAAPVDDLLEALGVGVADDVQAPVLVEGQIRAARRGAPDEPGARALDERPQPRRDAPDVLAGRRDEVTAQRRPLGKLALLGEGVGAREALHRPQEDAILGAEQRRRRVVVGGRLDVGSRRRGGRRGGSHGLGEFGHGALRFWPSADVTWERRDR